MVCSDSDEELELSDHESSSSHEEYSESNVLSSKGKTKTPPRPKKGDEGESSKPQQKIAHDKSPVPKTTLTPSKRLKTSTAPSTPVIILDDEDDSTSNYLPKKVVKRKRKGEEDDDEIQSPAPKASGKKKATPVALAATSRAVAGATVRNSQRSKSQVTYIELSSDESSEDKSDSDDSNEKQRKRKRVVKSKTTSSLTKRGKSGPGSDDEEDDEWSE
jgi:hypothetical protein